MTNHLSAVDIAAICEDPTKITPEQKLHLEQCERCREWKDSLQRVMQLIHGDVQIKLSETEVDVCPWSVETLAAAKGQKKVSELSAAMQLHFSQCEECRELFSMMSSVHREESSSIEEPLAKILELVSEFYGYALETINNLTPLAVEPAYRSSYGAAPKRYTLKVSDEVPILSVTLQEQSESHRYNVQIETPGAAVDLFSSDGQLLASYDIGTTQVFASAQTGYLVLQGKHFVQLSSEA